MPRAKVIRILHLINDFNGGGAQRLLIDLANQAGSTFEHHALCISSQGEMSLEANTAFKSVTYLGGRRNLGTFFETILALRRKVEHLKIDIVHSHLVQSDLVSALAPLPKSVSKIRTLHTSSLASSEKLSTRIAWFAIRLVKGRFDVLAACTPSAMRFALRTGQASPIQTVIPNGVTVDDKGIDPNLKFGGYFLVLARFHVVKDFPTLFKAFAKARMDGVSARLLLAGSGLTSENLELAAMIRDSGNPKNIELLGFQGKTSDLLRGAKFLVISSSYGEALPMVGLEAIASGVPVISTNVGDCKSLVVDERLLAQPSNPNSLAEAISFANSVSRDDYSRLSVTSHHLALTSFSLQKTSDEYENLYRQTTRTLRN